MFNNDWKLSFNSKTFDSLDCSLFRNFKPMTIFDYAFFILFLTGLKIALFVSDVYTCVKLLAFNTWSNNIIQPYIPFRISKWLFSGCILASVSLMLWEVVSGIHIYRTRNISLTYVNNFSRTVYSVSQYNKFCVYNRISPEGAFQKLAFFTFFELKDCLRLLLTDTPRQVINGLTLWSVLVSTNHDNLGKLENINGLLAKIKTIAQTNREEAVLLSFMLFSFVIWAFFISKFALACLSSIYVYYRLFNEGRKGLKEFVCVTVSQHVNFLVEKYRSKKRGVQGLGPEDKFVLNSSSTDLLTRVGNQDGSSANLLANIGKQDSSSTDLSTVVGKHDLELGFNDDDRGPEDCHRLIEMSKKPQVATGDLASLQDSGYEHAARSTDLLTKTESNEPVQALSPINNLGDSSNDAPGRGLKNLHVNTPEQAYFSGADQELPQRASSLWTRRERIQNENYEYYLNKH
ncbi:LADA_0B02850g1_1 [Lachancea dasiensis]|uniref:LADA_0B02850g1_1 n=1 Tax=Lachancea dasiensis TaxID=1072105 RepID=A0A1G4IS77_9SACH|nr:LADA_0B02850g1_1 [Lachancea dasiensis]